MRRIGAEEPEIETEELYFTTACPSTPPLRAVSRTRKVPLPEGYTSQEALSSRTRIVATRPRVSFAQVPSPV